MYGRKDIVQAVKLGSFLQTVQGKQFGACTVL